MKTAGLAMYTVRRAVAQDMTAAFCDLREMGYTGMEFYGPLDAFDPDKTRKALAESGMEMTGWHVEWRDLQPDRRTETLDVLARFGCPIAVVPCLGGKWNIGHDAREESLAVWLRYIEKLNALAEILANRGIRLGYHNHDHEFRLRYEGKSVFDHLFANLLPEIIMEFDTGNCIEGGGDPCEVLRRYAARDILLHLKPYSPVSGFDVTLGAPGDANDWKRILSVPGVHFTHLLVESEAEHLPEMENARLCLEGLRRIAAE